MCKITYINVQLINIISFFTYISQFAASLGFAWVLGLTITSYDLEYIKRSQRGFCRDIGGLNVLDPSVCDQPWAVGSSTGGVGPNALFHTVN